MPSVIRLHGKTLQYGNFKSGETNRYLHDLEITTLCQSRRTRSGTSHRTADQRRIPVRRVARRFLRALGLDEHITLLMDKDDRPYQRPALSKEWLHGKVCNESLIFRSNEHWVDHNLMLVKNERIKDVQRDSDDPSAGVAYAPRVQPTRTVASPLPWSQAPATSTYKVPLATLPGVVYLRNADDARHLEELVPQAKDLVIVGGEFIGRSVGDATSEYFMNAYRERGLDIRLEIQIEKILPEDAGNVKAVRRTGDTNSPPKSY